MTYFLLRCFICFSSGGSAWTPPLACFTAIFTFVWKVGWTKSSTMLHPANESRICLLGFKACWQMHAWMCYSAAICNNTYSSHETRSRCAQKHTHTHTRTQTCCDIFIFEVSWPTVHCNWFMLTGSLGISQHWIKSVHSSTDRIPTTLKGCTRICVVAL